MSGENAEYGLNPFERWMVKQNIEYAKAEGVATVLARLRVVGYGNVAAAVQAQIEADDERR